MKLFTEMVDQQSIEVLVEGSGTVAEKTFRIRGPFVQSEVLNRNGRIYPKHICEREVGLYTANFINTRRACGELDHPQTASINLDRVSHLIESLTMQGNDAIGCAKLLDTPMGRVAKSLLFEGVSLGVSTRGVGTLNGNKVNSDFRLLTVDIVSSPSAPSAFVQGILENREYIIEGDEIVEIAVANMKKRLDSRGSKAVFDAMHQFLKDLKTRI